MNRVVVIRAAAGLAAYLVDHGPRGRHRRRRLRRPAQLRRVRRGHRRGHGRRRACRRVLLPRPLPTPVLAYAIRTLGCVAGVMVTASHNPPQDNGYKVYLGDGSQIVPPADAEISAAIDAVGPLAGVPREAGWSRLGDEVVEAYLADVGAPGRAGRPAGPGHGLHPAARRRRRDRRHGDGAGRLPGAARRGRAGRARPGLPDRRVPEPRGARAPWTSRWRWPPRSTPTSWSPTTRTPTGARWRCRTRTAGGCCAATRSARCSATSCSAAAPRASTPPRSCRPRCSARSPPRTASRTTRRSPASSGSAASTGLAFGYEEALGYCVAPTLVRDKDGVSALLLVVELAARLKAEGRTLIDRLDDIAREHGLLRHRPALGPGHRPVADRATRWTRLRTHAARRRSAASRSSRSTTSPRAAADLPPTDGLRFRLADHARVDRAARPAPSRRSSATSRWSSRSTPSEQDGVDAARISAAGRLDAIRGDLAAAAGL